MSCPYEYVLRERIVALCLALHRMLEIDNQCNALHKARSFANRQVLRACRKKEVKDEFMDVWMHIPLEERQDFQQRLLRCLYGKRKCLSTEWKLRCEAWIHGRLALHEERELERDFAKWQRQYSQPFKLARHIFLVPRLTEDDIEYCRRNLSNRTRLRLARFIYNRLCEGTRDIAIDDVEGTKALHVLYKTLDPGDPKARVTFTCS